MIQRIKNLVFGSPLDPRDQKIFHHLSLIAFFAWVGLGADGLSSSCYGPEEAFLALGRHVHLSIFVALGTVLTIFIISSSYSQIIELFPTGGGGYLVASKLLGPSFGMVAGCALLIDYVLTITISVASGADALFSFLPPAFLAYKIEFAVGGVLLLIFLNLRGVKESVIPLVPVFLTFVFTHAFVILYGFFTHLHTLPIKSRIITKNIPNRATLLDILFFEGGFDPEYEISSINVAIIYHKRIHSSTFDLV
jgi:amino acid transporter